MLLLPPILSLGALSLSVYGWGRVVHIFLYGDRKLAHAYAAGLGIIVLTFVGGVLNAVGFAIAAVLTAISLMGIAFSLIFAVRSLRNWDAAAVFSRTNIPPCIYLVVAAGLTIFLALNLLPTRVFNHHDDFLTYFDRIVRMRETGAVSGNPFDLLGLTGFGADAFFQGLTMTWLPLASVTAFDAIFCFILGMLLLAEIGRQNSASWLLIGLAALVYVFINPQIVNVSSVYSIAVLLLTLTSATAILLSAENISTAKRLRYAVPVGASLAALVAFKSTTALFAIPFLVVVFGGLLLRPVSTAAASMLATLVSGAIAFLPWLLTQVDKVLVLLRARSVAIPVDPALTIPWSFAEAFRNGDTIYGSTRADYILALTSVMLMVLAGGWRFLRRTDHELAVVWTATGIGCLFAYVGIAGFHSNEASLRYAAPFLLTVAALATFALTPCAASDAEKRIRLGLMAAIVIAQLVSVTIFANSAYERVLRIATYHTLLSYPTNQQYRDLQARMLGQEGVARIRNAQAKTTAGTKIFVWVDLPFHMDFARNDILQFNSAFFLAPWRLDTANYESVRKEFKKLGINYILVEYGGFFATSLMSEAQLRSRLWPEDRITYENAARLLSILQQFSTLNSVIFAEGGMALIRLDDR